MPNRPGRLREFAYVGLNAYFLTICTEHRQRAFDDIAFGRWAASQLLQRAAERGFATTAYCLMPRSGAGLEALVVLGNPKGLPPPIFRRP